MSDGPAFICPDGSRINLTDEQAWRVAETLSISTPARRDGPGQNWKPVNVHPDFGGEWDDPLAVPVEDSP